MRLKLLADESMITSNALIMSIIIMTVTIVVSIYIRFHSDITRTLNKRKEKQHNNASSKKALNFLTTNFPNLNIPSFLCDRYNDFLEIQKAWMNFDYDKLKELLTDELYNQYIMQLDTLKNDYRRNIMNDFKLNGYRILDAYCDNQILTIKMELDCSFHDFIEKFWYVSRGNTNIIINHVYELTFVCNLADKGEFCPNCGSKIDKRKNRCSYCGGIFSNIANKWVMSNKMSKVQRDIVEW